MTLGRVQNRHLVVITATLIGVVVAALIVFWPRGGDDAESATADAAEAPPDTAAEQLAAGFVDAYANHDADLAASYLNEELLTSRFKGLEALKLETSWMALTGGEILAGPCQHHDTSSVGVIVRCSYEFHGLRSDELGLGPYGGNHYEVTVSDGHIVGFDDHIAFLTNGFSEEMWKPFARWIADNHPDDIDTMYTSPAMTFQRASDESNQLWEQRTREYADSNEARALDQ